MRTTNEKVDSNRESNIVVLSQNSFALPQIPYPTSYINIMPKTLSHHLRFHIRVHKDDAYEYNCLSKCIISLFQLCSTGKKSDRKYRHQDYDFWFFVLSRGSCVQVCDLAVPNSGEIDFRLDREKELYADSRGNGGRIVLRPSRECSWLRTMREVTTVPAVLLDGANGYSFFCKTCLFCCFRC